MFIFRHIGPFAGLTFRPDEPPGGGGAPPAPPTPPAPTPSNAEAAAQRIAEREKKRADDLEARLKKIEDDKLDEKAKAEKRATEAEARATAAEEKATRAEVRTKLQLAASGKVANAKAVVDLSEAKLLELAQASDEEILKHVEDTAKAYDLPGPGGKPATFGAPPKDDPAGPGGGGTDDKVPGQVPGATGDPTKDYRRGIGAGIIGALRGRGVAAGQVPGSEDED